MQTPIKSKNSAPLVLTNAWNQENMVAGYEHSTEVPPKPPKKALYLMIDGLQHFVPFEHMPIIAEFTTTQILRIAEVSRPTNSRLQHLQSNHYLGPSPNICGPGFLTQFSSSLGDSSVPQHHHRVQADRTPTGPVTYYLINPKGDLKNTERQMKQFVGKFKNWVGKVGEEPTSREIVGYLQDHIDFM